MSNRPAQEDWFRFVTAATRSGYDWLTGVATHIGALLLVLGLIGVPFVLAFSYERWIFTPVSLVIVVVLLFSIGAHRMWKGSETERARLQAVIDQREERREAISVEIHFDPPETLQVYVRNKAASLSDARINLFIPRLPDLTLKRLDEKGSIASAGHRSESPGRLMDGVDGTYRWSEMHLFLPGANTNYVLRFGSAT